MSFSSIIGHERQIDILKRALANGSVAHAYLFSGEEGVGKRMTALAVGAALNCAEPGPDGGCGACPSCRKAAAGSHPDITVLMPESEDEQRLALLSKKDAEKASDRIKIEQVRVAQERLSLKAYEGSRKVLIVDRADAMTEEAMNAFLKTLEEPPGESLIVLITARPQALLATNRSRCQEVKFQPLPRRRIAAKLRDQRGLDEADAWFLAALCQGSIGRALEMDAAAERQERTELAAVLDRLAGMSDDEVLTLADGVSKDREGFLRLVDISIERLRDQLVWLLTGNEQLLVFPPGAAGRTAGPAPRLLQDLELFTSSRRMLQGTVSAPLVAEHLFLTLARG